MSDGEENKALIRGFFAAWNEGKLDDCYALLATEIVEHAVPPGFPPGLGASNKALPSCAALSRMGSSPLRT